MHTPRNLRRRPPGDVAALPDDLHPLLRRIYAARDVTDVAELDYALARLAPFEGLGGADQAAARIADAIARDQRIVILADYDADGATACALGIRGLRAMGAAHVDYVVPDRARHGYGLSPGIVDEVAALDPDLLITVDNGISSHAGAAACADRGIDLIITDHHLPGESLPRAAAVVNPNLPGDRFPSKALAGVGVMFYVLAALRALLRSERWFEKTSRHELNLAALLDLVSVGTVADMVPLDANNRILVHQGLARIAGGRCVPGIAALLRVARRNERDPAANDLAFAVGPRLNAAGRLTDMRLGIECLLSDEPRRALSMAAQLDALNRERREIQAEMQQQAMEDLSRLGDAALSDAPAGVCLYDVRWHAGVVGILASQIKERVQRPVMAFAPEADGTLKGSGRSVDGVHIRDVLVNVDRRAPGLIRRYGGHAMAAGLSIDARRFEEFAVLFADEVGSVMPDPDASAVLYTDGELDGAALNLETARLLRAAGPWGQGFPEPLFDGTFEVRSSDTVGGTHLKLQLQPVEGARAVEAIGFGMGARAGDATGCIRAAYRLDVNEFGGRRSLQLLLEHFESL